MWIECYTDGELVNLDHITHIYINGNQYGSYWIASRTTKMVNDFHKDITEDTPEIVLCHCKDENAAWWTIDRIRDLLTQPWKVICRSDYIKYAQGEMGEYPDD